MGNDSNDTVFRRIVAESTSLIARTWRQLLVDLVIVIGWTIVLAIVFVSFGWSRRLYYLILVGSVVAYTLIAGMRRSPGGTKQ